MTRAVSNPSVSDAVQVAVRIIGEEVQVVVRHADADGYRAWRDDAMESLMAENLRLRGVLRGCVNSCSGLIEHAEASGHLEGREGEHAEAWLALENAREALALHALGLTLPPGG